MSTITKIVNLVQLRPQDRKASDIEQLLTLTRDITFFKEWIDCGQPDVHRKCCAVLQYEEQSENNIVFEIGSQGGKFYVILEGEVGVFIRKAKVTQEEITQVKTNPPQNSLQKITNLLKEKKFISSPNKLDQFQNGEIKQNVLKTINRMAANSRLSLLSKMHPSMDDGLFCVSTLRVGQSFGELALLSDRPRLATIVCNKNCKFGVLDKLNFEKILKEQEEIKTLKALRLYASLPIFENFSIYLLKQIHWITSRIKFKKNEKVFSFGEESDAMYIVNAGEFLIYQKFNQTKKTEKEEEENQYLQEEQFFQNSQIDGQYQLDNSDGIKRFHNSSSSKFIQGIDIQVGLKLPYQLIGEEDLLDNSQRRYNVMCASTSGELIRIKSRDFKQKILNDESAKKYLDSYVPQKKQTMSIEIASKKQTILDHYQYLTQSKKKESISSQIYRGELNPQIRIRNPKINIPTNIIPLKSQKASISFNFSSSSQQEFSNYSTNQSDVHRKQNSNELRKQLTEENDQINDQEKKPQKLDMKIIRDYQINSGDPLLRGFCIDQKHEVKIIDKNCEKNKNYFPDGKMGLFPGYFTSFDEKVQKKVMIELNHRQDSPIKLNNKTHLKQQCQHSLRQEFMSQMLEDLKKRALTDAPSGIQRVSNFIQKVNIKKEQTLESYQINKSQKSNSHFYIPGKFKIYPMVVNSFQAQENKKKQKYLSLSQKSIQKLSGEQQLSPKILPPQQMLEIRSQQNCFNNNFDCLNPQPEVMSSEFNEINSPLKESIEQNSHIALSQKEKDELIQNDEIKCNKEFFHNSKQFLNQMRINSINRVQNKEDSILFVQPQQQVKTLKKEIINSIISTPDLHIPLVLSNQRRTQTPNGFNNSPLRIEKKTVFSSINLNSIKQVIYGKTDLITKSLILE